MRLRAWKAMRRGNLRGFAVIDLPNGLQISDIMISDGKNGLFARLPQRPVISRGELVRGDGGSCTTPQSPGRPATSPTNSAAGWSTWCGPRRHRILRMTMSEPSPDSEDPRLRANLARRGRCAEIEPHD